MALLFQCTFNRTNGITDTHKNTHANAFEHSLFSAERWKESFRSANGVQLKKSTFKQDKCDWNHSTIPFARSEKNVSLWHKIVQLCSNMQYARTRPSCAYFADTVFGIFSLDARETSGRRQNQSIPHSYNIIEWRFGILCLNISLF